MLTPNLISFSPVTFCKSNYQYYPIKRTQHTKNFTQPLAFLNKSTPHNPQVCSFGKIHGNPFGKLQDLSTETAHFSNIHESSTKKPGTQVARAGAASESNPKGESKAAEVAATSKAKTYSWRLCSVSGSQWVQGYHKAIETVGKASIFYIWVLLSGIFYHLYNQSSYQALDDISPLTFSVGNTMRVVVIVSTVLVFRNPVRPLNALGSGIAILGTFLYSQAIAKKKSTEGEKKS